MKFALVLSGCGQFDGSETHEVILSLLSLAQEGVSWDAFAPDIMQQEVINHYKNEVVSSDSRSVLAESARLVRGHIKPITEANINEYDAVLFPGGFGVVVNLCDWRDKKWDYRLNPDVADFMEQAKAKAKPMGFICIAPVLIPKLFPGAKMTVGNDQELMAEINAMGCETIVCDATEVAVDQENKIVSTPANMVKATTDQLYQGIHQLVKELVVLAS